MLTPGCAHVLVCVVLVDTVMFIPYVPKMLSAVVTCRPPLGSRGKGRQCYTCPRNIPSVGSKLSQCVIQGPIISLQGQASRRGRLHTENYEFMHYLFTEPLPAGSNNIPVNMR